MWMDYNLVNQAILVELLFFFKTDDIQVGEIMYKLMIISFG